MKRNICIRIIEMFLGSVILSSIVCFFCVQGIIPAEGLLRDGTLTALPIIYIVWNVFSLRRCYVALDGDKTYYFTNFLATGVLAVASLFFYHYLQGTTYSWLFLVTGLGSFLNFYIPGIVAITTFHTILFLSIFFAPIGLGWIKMVKKENEELLERVPGNLEVNPLEQKAYTEVYMDESKDKKTKNSVS